MITPVINVLNKNILYSPQSFTFKLSFLTNQNQYIITNSTLAQGYSLGKIQSIMIDNLDSTVNTTIKLQKTGQQIVCAPYTMLALPLLMSENDEIIINNLSLDYTLVSIILTDRNLSAGQYTTGGK